MLITNDVKGDPLLISHIKQTLRAGYSPIILVVGRQRSGKTYFAMLLGELLEKDFKVEDSLVVNMLDFTQMFSRKENSVIILDEAGISLDAQRTQETTQRVYSHIVQSQAYKQNVIILCLPSASDFGRSHKVHIDTICEVRGRGTVKVYSLWFWRANPSDCECRCIQRQTLTGVPLPSERNREVYQTMLQTQTKESILSEQLLILQEKALREERIRQIRANKLESEGAKKEAPPPEEVVPVPDLEG